MDDIEFANCLWEYYLLRDIYNGPSYFHSDRLFQHELYSQEKSRNNNSTCNYRVAFIFSLLRRH
jgi:hypothetical protein